MKKFLIICSVLLNIVFCLMFLWNNINTPSYKYGVLKNDVEVGIFSSDSLLFTLPKGLTVKNVSPRGLNAIGQFEGNRFELVITTDRDDLVDYNVSESEQQCFGNYYSADCKKYNFIK